MNNKHIHPIMANLLEDIKRFRASEPPTRPPIPPTQWTEETVYVGQLDYTVPTPVAAELASLRRLLAAETELYCDVRACLDIERQKYNHRRDQIAALRRALEAAATVLDNANHPAAATLALHAARGYE